MFVSLKLIILKALIVSFVISFFIQYFTSNISMFAKNVIIYLFILMNYLSSSNTSSNNIAMIKSKNVTSAKK